MSERSERLMEVLRALINEDRATLWRIGDVIWQLAGEYPHKQQAWVEAARALGGRHVTWAERLARTAMVFPDEATRALSPQWELYRLAGMTDQPQLWLRWAIEWNRTDKELAAAWRSYRQTKLRPVGWEEITTKYGSLERRAGEESGDVERVAGE